MRLLTWLIGVTVGISLQLGIAFVLQWLFQIPWYEAGIYTSMYTVSSLAIILAIKKVL